MNRWYWWYLRPRYVLWRYARWNIYMADKPSSFAPIVEMYKLGCMPIGYSKNPTTGASEFVVYVPEAMA